MVQFDIDPRIDDQINNLVWRLQQENPNKTITKKDVLLTCVEAGLEILLHSMSIAGYKLADKESAQ